MEITLPRFLSVTCSRLAVHAAAALAALAGILLHVAKLPMQAVQRVTAKRNCPTDITVNCSFICLMLLTFSFILQIWYHLGL